MKPSPKPTRILATRRPPYRVEREKRMGDDVTSAAVQQLRDEAAPRMARGEWTVIDDGFVRFERKRIAKDFRSLADELKRRSQRE